MPDVLVIGSMTGEMEEALVAHLTIHRFETADLTQIAATTNYVLTGGAEGIDPATMNALPNLQVISCYGVGYDAIDAVEAARRGILVTHTPDVLNGEVATTTLLLMMACYREFLRDEAWARSGTWEAKGAPPLTRSMDGQRIGIVGMGRIGQEIARRLAPFDPEIAYHTRTEKLVPYRFEPGLVALARASDCLIVITPGGAATRHLINREVMEALGPDGTLINVARGSVVDEDALVACLRDGKLGWAGLDVFENEPRIPDALRLLPNTVLLPHVGSATVETRRAMGALAVANITDHLTLGSVRTPVPECAGLLTG